MARTLRARSRLGKYRIISRLEVGGFATVFSAWDSVERVRVALKVTDEDASASVVERLESEIQLAARLDHPGILRLRNADRIDGRLVAAYPLGVESLASRLQRRIGTARALDVTEQILAALAHAHEQRVIHLDVKPGNVILFDDGSARLSDFGLARVARRTELGSGSGTIGYIAPEQAMGRPSFRSDVFSAALLLFRMLAGELPHWPFRWPLTGHARVRAKTGPPMMALLERALDVNHRRRYANCVTLLRAFRAARRQLG